MKKVAFIDNLPYAIAEGETMLSFIRRHKGENAIQTLCDAPNLTPFGSCRICSVDVALKKDGPAKSLASCHTPVAEGSYIYPDSKRIQDLRRNIVELVLTDHKDDCVSCELDNNCQLQDVIALTGVRQVRYPPGKNHFDTKKDDSHPYLISDLSKCINCFRCIRACDEVQGQFVLSMAGRGFESHVIKGMDTSFRESECVSCGACAQACPTSAISDVFESKSLKFDRKVRTVCTYCGVGCNLDVAVYGKEIKSIEAPYDAEVNHGHTCLKGRYAFSFYNHPERLKTPLIKKNGKFIETTWEEAYGFIAKKLEEIKKTNGPDFIAGISSARCTNEENYLMQKFMRAVIGTNNIDSCARVCHSPTALGMQRTLGTGAATNSINDLNLTDCILLIGANPTEAHPVTGAKIKQAALSGKTLIVIDPRKIELARYSDYHLQPRPGTNVAVLNMMLYYIISEGLGCESFIENRTEGYAEFSESILKLDMDELEKTSGVQKDLVRKAAVAYASAPNAMSFHGLGVTEHSQGTFAVMLIANLAMITGNIGKPGAGVNPLRGQNNVQGAADMGCQPHQGAGYLDIANPVFHKKYEEFYKAKLPVHPGYKIPEMFDATLNNKLKALWVIGEDIAQTDPNTKKVVEALKKLDLLVVQELFMTETAKLATVVLPGSSVFEKEGTFTNGERRIQRVNKVVDPIGNSKPDGQIIAEMMIKMGYPQAPYDASGLLAEISQIVPFFKGVKRDELGINGKQWPVAEDGSGTLILHKESFPNGRAKFAFSGFRESEEIKNNLKDYPFIITTNRQLEHYNCGAMTRRTLNAELRSEDVLLINPEDARKNSIAEGDVVCVESPRGKAELKAKITDDVKPGILSSTFHFPEIMLNNITSDIHDSEAMCPEYKVVACRISKTKGKPRGKT